MEQLNLTLRDKTAVFKAYMPFVKGGALFVPTPQAFSLGDSVTLNLELPDSQETLIASTKVVWITPRGASGQRLSGVGLQLLGENALEINKKIETYIAGMQNAGRTHTM